MPTKIQEWQEAGFSDEEISAYLQKKTSEWRAADFSEEEIQTHLGIKEFDSESLKELLLGAADNENLEWRQAPDPGEGFIQTISKAFKGGAERMGFADDWEAQKAKATTSIVKAAGTEFGPSVFDYGLGIVEGIKYGAKISTPGLIYGGLPKNPISPEAYNNLSAKDRATIGTSQLLLNLPIYAAGAGLTIAGGALTGTAAIIGGMAGAFGLEQGLHKIFMDKYEKGEIAGVKEFFTRLNDAIWETYKGLATGAVVGTARGTSTGVKALAKEIPVLVNVSAWMEGRLAKPKEYIDASIILVGIKGAGRGAKVLRDHFLRTGQRPTEVVQEFIDENWQDGRELPYLVRRDPRAVVKSTRLKSEEEWLKEIGRVKKALAEEPTVSKKFQKPKVFSGEPEPYGGPLTPEQRYLQNKEGNKGVSAREVVTQDIADEGIGKIRRWKAEDRPWSVREELQKIIDEGRREGVVAKVKEPPKTVPKVKDKEVSPEPVVGEKSTATYSHDWDLGEGPTEYFKIKGGKHHGSDLPRAQIEELGIRITEEKPIVGDPDGLGKQAQKRPVTSLRGEQLKRILKDVKGSSEVITKYAVFDSDKYWGNIEKYSDIVVEWGPEIWKGINKAILVETANVISDRKIPRVEGQDLPKLKAESLKLEAWIMREEKTYLKLAEKKSGKGLDFLTSEDGFLDLGMIGEGLEKIGKTAKDFEKWVAKEAPYLAQQPFWKGKEMGKELNNLRKELVSLPWWKQKNDLLFRPYFWIKDRASEAGSEMAFRLLEKHDPLFRLRGKDYEDWKRIAIRSDREGYEYTDLKDYTTKTGDTVSEKVFETYKAIRKNLDEQWEFVVQAVRRSGAPEEGVQKLITEIGKVKGYLPRIRKGKYFLRAEKEGEPNVRAPYDNQGELAKLKAGLEKEGYVITETGEVPISASELYSKMDVNVIGALLDTATNKWDQAQRDLLFKEVSDVLKSHGFLERAIGRKKDYIKGFEEKNLKRVILDHTTGMAGLLEKMEVAREFRRQWFEDLGDKKLDNVHKKDIGKYIRDGLLPTSREKILSAKVRALIFSKYLGLSLRAAMVNLSSQATAAAPRLGLDTKMAYVKLTNAMNDYTVHMIGKGMGKAVEVIIGEKLTTEKTYKATPLKAEEMEVIWEGLRKGFVQDQYTQEMMQGLNTFGTAGRVVSKILSGPMSITEKFNRITVLLAAFRVFRYEQGLPRPEALEKAKEVVYDAHGLYKEYNLPGIFRGGKLQDLGRTAYTFRFYTHNLLHLMANMTGEKPVQVAKALGTMFLLAGLSGTPFYGSIEAFLARQGVNPRSEIKKWAEEHDIESLADFINWGLGGVLGVDFSGSLGINLPGEGEIATGDVAEIIGQVAEDIGGVPISLAKDFLVMLQQLGYGDIKRAIEKSPVTLNILASYLAGVRMEKEGMTTTRGDLIRDEGGKQVMLTSEAIKLKKLGAQPVEISEQYRAHTARKWEVARWEREKADIRVRFKKAAASSDWDELTAISNEIVSLNVEKPFHITPIDTAELWKEIQVILPPSVREILLQQEMR